MPQLTFNQRQYFVEEIIKHGSTITTLHRFQAKYGKKLFKRIIQTNYVKWKVHGTIFNLNKGNSGQAILKQQRR